MSYNTSMFYTRWIKPVIDRLLALLLITLFTPVALVVALAIRVSMGSPVVFAQRRPGKEGKIFTIYKFRTMSDARDADGELLPDEARLGKVGRLIRSTSLDELPQLWNMLKGDMSFIGPRPLLVEYLPLYNERQKKRHDVLPGITGWAQVNGRNAISWQQKFDLDVWYVEHMGFLTDLRVIGKSFAAVFGRKGISQEGQATMEKFNGNN